MFLALILLVLLSLLIDLLALTFWKPAVTNHRQFQGPLPRVSILVPVRNEERNVDGLIDSLRSLDYPGDKIEILIGEDRSEDQTPQILDNIVGSDPRFKVISIDKDLEGLVAKANVLAQLIPHCTSPFYFITDADVRVPSTWIQALLSKYREGVGVIGGTTVVKVRGFWSGLQNIEWLFAQGLLMVTARFFRTIAVSGTNMMITSEVCQAIGGYEKIPHALTEDIGVLTAALESGYGSRNVMDQAATAVIEAQPDWRSLISQRARWSYGALRLPKFIVLLLIARSLFLFLLLALAWWWPLMALLIYLVKIILDLLFIRSVSAHLNNRVSFMHILFFEPYWSLISICGLLKHLFWSQTEWKGRTY